MAPDLYVEVNRSSKSRIPLNHMNRSLSAMLVSVSTMARRLCKYLFNEKLSCAFSSSFLVGVNTESARLSALSNAILASSMY